MGLGSLFTQGSHCLISHPKAATLNVGHAQTRPAEEGGDTEVGPGGWGHRGRAAGGGHRDRPGGRDTMVGLEADTEVSLGEGDTELGPGGGGHRGSSESRLSPPPCCNKGTERKATPTGSRRGLGAVRGGPVSWLPGTLRVLRIFFSYLRFPQGFLKGG